MKLNKKIVAPALSLVAMLGLGVGTTYALFTSEAKNDVAIQAGKVVYNQVANDLKTFSGVELTGDPATDVIEETAVLGTFTNGGTAVLQDGVLTLDKLTPGDKVTFNLVIKNSSNVKTKMRTIRSVLSDDGLFDGLQVKIDGQLWDGNEEMSLWEAQDGVATETETHLFAISVELPSNAGNEFQEKKCSIRFAVEAVQANASVVNPISVYDGQDLLADYSNLHKAIEACKNNAYTLKLNSDITLRSWEAINAWNGVYNGFVLDGQGHSIKNLVVDGVDEAGMFVGVASSLTVKNVVFDEATITTKEGLSQSYAGVVISKAYCDFNFENITVKNSIINNSWQCGGIVGFGESVNVVFNNCAVEDSFFGGEGATAGVLFGLGVCNVAVANSTATDVMLYTDSLTWNSTAKQVGNFAVGHVYTGTLTTTNYVETGVKVYVAEGLAINDAGEYEVSNGKGLVAFGAIVDGGDDMVGKTVKLVDDIDMTGIAFNPIGEVGYPQTANVFCGNFDGQDHVISNLTVTDQQSAGLFASLGGTIKDVTVDGATINSNHYAGGIVGWVDDSQYVVIDNAKVINSTIVTAAEDLGTEWDNGDKAGGIVGYTASKPTVKNCTVEDCTVQGYRDIGGLIGFCSTGTVDGNTVKNVVLVNDRTHDYKGYGADESKYDVNELIGENAGGTIGTNTVSGVTKQVIPAI